MRKIFGIVTYFGSQLINSTRPVGANFGGQGFLIAALVPSCRRVPAACPGRYGISFFPPGKDFINTPSYDPLFDISRFTASRSCVKDKILPSPTELRGKKDG